MENKVYVSYNEEQKDGTLKKISGIFDLKRETDDYIIISSKKNTIQISRKDIIKFKKRND
ncbi:MAG: hypothetical protein WC346_09205 [Methanogenium sp.]|jgi:hypothetical protein